jgi:hypothetical protein
MDALGKSREHHGNSEGLFVQVRLRKGPGLYSFDRPSACVLAVNDAFSSQRLGFALAGPVGARR